MTEEEKDLRTRLVAAGVELLARDGVQALGLREIARQAGVSHGAPRRYFPTHRELLAAIARHGFGKLTDTLATADALAATDGLPPRERLTGLARAYLRFAAANPGMFELMFRHDLLEGSGADLRSTSLPLFRTFTRLVGEASPERDATTTAVALLANLHGLAQLRTWGSLRLLTGDDDVAPLLAAIVDAHVGAPAQR
ncbi:TetR/AcrR family transcriptional regulator [Streptomyces sp. SP17BM10]|uniref:TetR/AcrR family transcriptional regulator n=1 Tax=Streptomyces sp. SP17BM10 TaxID=3002530 RepID=UPI002E7738D6|nr:TetR/AcrR family transcriptional regulator [Streptomyces sp. SP17BM10]MEE1783677.1 TetR/AcrR family transcriptional regulator [Streptomyces sp. SP17BM10]